MNCNVFKKSIYHFQAEELSADERAAMQQHLNGCPPCAERLEFESGMLDGLKGRLQAIPAPPGLETRVRAELAQQAGGSAGALGWLRTPWFAALAASMLLAMLLIPIGGAPEQRAVEQVSELVTVVDRECDRKGADLADQRGCRHPRHLNALKRADGSYLNVSLEGELGRKMITDREMRGHRLRVEGLLFPRIETLKIDQLDDLGTGNVALLSSYRH